MAFPFILLSDRPLASNITIFHNDATPCGVWACENSNTIFKKMLTMSCQRRWASDLGPWRNYVQIEAGYMVRPLAKGKGWHMNESNNAIYDKQIKH